MKGAKAAPAFGKGMLAMMRLSANFPTNGSFDDALERR